MARITNAGRAGTTGGDMQELIEMVQEIKTILSQNSTEFMTIEEAAEYCKLSTQTIHKHKEQIGYSKPDRKVLIKKEDLINWINNFYKQAKY